MCPRDSYGHHKLILCVLSSFKPISWVTWELWCVVGLKQEWGVACTEYPIKFYFLDHNNMKHAKFFYFYFYYCIFSFLFLVFVGKNDNNTFILYQEINYRSLKTFLNILKRPSHACLLLWMTIEYGIIPVIKVVRSHLFIHVFYFLLEPSSLVHVVLCFSLD